MSDAPSGDTIRLRGVRHNNLQGFDLDLPCHRLIVVTGLSGSGKSSLAFDTLFAEGQRRYIETFSPYARQFFDRMDKPRVDSIEGIPPAIAIEQRNAVRTTRSTVGTMTEICDYLKLLWPHLAQLHCRKCGQPVGKDSPQLIWQQIQAEPTASGTDLLITFDLPLSEKLSLADSLALVARQGYQRLLLDGEIVRVEEAAPRLDAKRTKLTQITVVQDRLRPTPSNRPRFIEACEQAYHFGKGRLTLFDLVSAPDGGRSTVANPRFFSNSRHCARCDIAYREPTPALFSFNHPIGACPTCRGFGRTIAIDYNLAIPDRSKTLAEGAVKPWQTGTGAECQVDLERFCRAAEIPLDVPFRNLSRRMQDWIINGDPHYGEDDEHEWPRAWYGVKGYFRWLESKAYKMHVRVLLSRYRRYQRCPDCQGRRFQPESLEYRVHLASRTGPGAPLNSTSTSLPPALTLADFYALPMGDALSVIEQLGRQRTLRRGDPLCIVLDEVRARLGYLVEVGLGYLTLDRPTRTLSGGETERVNLTTCLGTRLVNTLFVLDEPSVGLHPRDTARLVSILEKLRDAENTVVVVEHEAGVIRSADQVVDLGPGHGEAGGRVVFQGTYAQLVKSSASLTGQYLSGRRQIEIPVRRPVPTSLAVGAGDRLTDPEEERGLEGERGRVPSSRGRRAKLKSASNVTVPARSRLSANRTESRRSAPLPISDTEAALLNQPGNSLPAEPPVLRVIGARRHNLKNLTVAIPLNRFVVISGVSGSGKSTFAREVLWPTLMQSLQAASPNAGTAARGSRVKTGLDEDEADALATGEAPSIEGWERLGNVVMVDQSPIGRTPRSNPAVYVGAFDEIRAVYATSEEAAQRGLSASAFSFNSAEGQCERCRGAGFEKIEMQFLSDVFIRCPDCDGRRYRSHILEVKLSPPVATERPRARKAGLPLTRSLSPSGGEGARRAGEGEAVAPTHDSETVETSPKKPSPAAAVPASLVSHPLPVAWSIADCLEATVDEAIDFLRAFSSSAPAQRAVEKLRLLQEVGLGYLRLGQPINTLSGGESQRLKLVAHLAESVARGKGPNATTTVTGASPDGLRSVAIERTLAAKGRASSRRTRPAATARTAPLPTSSPPAGNLFIFDEPTTGLHFDDVRVLLGVFQRLVDAGHSVLVIEHNLEVIKCADWVIDLGPDAGAAGGEIVVAGTPEKVAGCTASHTGAALRPLLPCSG